MLTGREADLAASLRQAAAAGQTQVVLKLLEEGAPFVLDSDGQTALHQAAAGGHSDTVAALLLGGCDVSIQDFTGHTALQRAAAEGHVEIVKQLIKQGASVDHQDEVHGNTALHEAAWKGFSQTVGVLCRAKANFYIKNRGGFAPLHLCCQNGHNETCRVLLLAGCKPDIKNNYGDTPLHTSARYGHAGVIRILVSANCNPSEQNKNGDTALHIAAAMGRRKLTKILLESGCDKEAKNKQGETAQDISKRKNLQEIIAILQNPPPVLSQADRQDEADKARERSQSSKGEKRRDKSGGKDATPKDKDTSNIKHKDKDKKKSRTGPDKASGSEYPDWSPYGCHDEPDLEEFPLPRMDTIPEDPLRAGEQYYFDLAGNIRKGPTTRVTKHHNHHGQQQQQQQQAQQTVNSCHCGPAFTKFEKKLEKDKRELMKHIDSSHTKLDNKILHLERRTKDQLFNLNQTMKETFATERSECLDRMDRRALRERIAIERQQAVRDISLKRDLASWLDKKLREIETRTGADAQSAALLRNLALKAARRAAAVGAHHNSGGDETPDLAALSDWDTAVMSSSSIGNHGTLRRAMSEELLSDVGSVVAADSHHHRRRQRRNEDASGVLDPGDGGRSDKESGNPENRISRMEVVEEDSAGCERTVYKGLKVSDRPSSSNGGASQASRGWPGERTGQQASWQLPQALRVRRNSMDDENHHLLQKLMLDPISLTGTEEPGANLSGRANNNNSPYNLAYSTNSESCQDTASHSERGSVTSSRDGYVSSSGGGRRPHPPIGSGSSNGSRADLRSTPSGAVGGPHHHLRSSAKEPPQPPLRTTSIHNSNGGGGGSSGGALIRPIPSYNGSDVSDATSSSSTAAKSHQHRTAKGAADNTAAAPSSQKRVTGEAGSDNSNSNKSDKNNNGSSSEAGADNGGSSSGAVVGLPYKNQLRRFTTQADIHHAMPLMLEEPEPEPFEGQFQQSYLIPPVKQFNSNVNGKAEFGDTSTCTTGVLPPYRLPPVNGLPPTGGGSGHPPHLYHPRDKLPRQGPVLPPVEEDEYVHVEDKDQDFHRQLLNLPLNSDGGSHDSHNDSGYSTRLGASAGPSPSLSGSRPGSTDGDGLPTTSQHHYPQHHYQPGYPVGQTSGANQPGGYHQPAIYPAVPQPGYSSAGQSGYLSGSQSGQHSGYSQGQPAGYASAGNHTGAGHVNGGHQLSGYSSGNGGGYPNHHHQQNGYPPAVRYTGGVGSGPAMGGQELGLPQVGPRIRDLQNKLKLTEISGAASDAKGSLV